MEEQRHFLDRFFWPKSVAVVGATNNPFKPNYQLVRNLVKLNFEGKVYPVNPNTEEIYGVKAFPRLKDIPEKIDIVVTAVPAVKTMGIVRECDEIGVKQLIIVAGGFSEAGTQGKRLHEEIASFTKERGIRTLGPNTLTPFNTSNNFVISYNPVKKLRRGPISFAFQSGFYEPKINWMFSHLGINKMLDMGNKMDINEVDALEYFADDPKTEIIVMHVESLRGNGREFFNLLDRVSRQKPTIILKSGRTPTGSKAAASHTGSIASENDMIFDSMIKQTAAIRAQNMEEFFDLAKAFEYLPVPLGNGLAIITFSGGEGVMATDASEMKGLKLALFKDETHQRLKVILPTWEIPLNPFDAGVCMQFQFTDLKTFFNTLLFSIAGDENVDCTIMQVPPILANFLFKKGRDNHEEINQPLAEEFVETFVNIKKVGKPFAMWRSSDHIRELRLVEMMESRGLSVFRSPECAITALAAMNRYRERRSYTH